ncbi:MAG: DNA polymerase/3'-5' exonuclease PolX [Phycisphaerales bacterium JB058]
MGFNADLHSRLDEMATLLELTGANRFRVNAFARAARAVESQTKDLSTLDEKELVAIDGIGKGIASFIRELADTDAVAELESLRAEVPAGLADVLDIQGLGPKTVRLMWQDLGITDRSSLKKAIDDGSLLTLPRMGEKTVENIKAALTFASKSNERLALGIASPIAEAIVERMRKVKGVKQCAFAGSMRRGRDTIGDIDILVSTTNPEAAAEAFCEADNVERVIARGETKCSVRVTVNGNSGRWKSDGKLPPTIGADLRIVPDAGFGAALMYFSGSKEHNVRLRERALKKGMTLNEYGLFPEDKSTTESPQSRGIKSVAAKTEEAIYTKLGLPYIPPEIREDAGELDLEETPALIELADIKSDLHAHTTASDGLMSLHELVQCAIDRGFHTIAVTDHSKSSVQAGGLSVERLRAQRDEIEEARKHFGKKITILAGSEVDILADGSLDYDDDILAWLDIVVASPHAALSQDSKAATKRLLKAIEHPNVNIIGHPTGRLINRRKGLEPAMDEIIAAAVEHDTALEINAHWMRLDLRDTHVRAAAEAGCKIAIDCDDHAPTDFDNIRFGIATARRGWLTPELCVNTWTPKKLHNWLKKKR